MIDIDKEEMLPPREARDHQFIRNGGPPASPAKMWRLFNLGSRPKGGGERVKLEFIQTAAGPRTSRQAIERFKAALNGEAPAAAKPRQSHDAAHDEMAAAGYVA